MDLSSVRRSPVGTPPLSPVLEFEFESSEGSESSALSKLMVEASVRLDPHASNPPEPRTLKRQASTERIEPALKALRGDEVKPDILMSESGMHFYPIPESFDSLYTQVFPTELQLPRKWTEQLEAKRKQLAHDPLAWTNGLRMKNRVYIGELQNGLPQGFGKLVGPKMIQIGTFQNGVLHREGCQLEVGKAIYEGEFSQGNMHGLGTLMEFDESGNCWKYQGYFSENTLVDGGKKLIDERFEELFAQVHYAEAHLRDFNSPAMGMPCERQDFTLTEGDFSMTGHVLSNLPQRQAALGD
jgi:hypothetical protein